jgi:hypothetical protein
VLIRAPEGARIALAVEENMGPTHRNEVLVGLQIGPVYRLAIADIPNQPAVVIFPTLELIDRLHPPPNLALRYPIPIELTQEELELAARGAFVTRVIYVEDPLQAPPIAQDRDSEQRWMEAPPGEDPLVTADRFGRPVAILRIGGRVPGMAGPAAVDASCPPLRLYDPSTVAPANCRDGTPALQAQQAPAAAPLKTDAIR